MEIYLVTIGFMGVMVLLMAVGVMLGREPLKGSCGGVGGNCPCAEAGTPGACKIEGGLEEGSGEGEVGLNAKKEMSATEGEDGVIRYS
jgi:hypothetical protein